MKMETCKFKQKKSNDFMFPQTQAQDGWAQNPEDMPRVKTICTLQRIFQA